MRLTQAGVIDGDLVHHRSVDQSEQSERDGVGGTPYRWRRKAYLELSTKDGTQMSDPLALTGVLGELLELTGGDQDRPQILQAVVEFAKRTVPGVDETAITLIRRNKA